MVENRNLYGVCVIKAESRDIFSVEFLDFDDAVTFVHSVLCGEKVAEVQLWYGDTLVNSWEQ